MFRLAISCSVWGRAEMEIKQVATGAKFNKANILKALDLLSGALGFQRASSFLLAGPLLVAGPLPGTAVYTTAR